MNMKELRKYLAKFNDTAKVEVIVDNRPADFGMRWGRAEGGTKAKARVVAFVVGGTNESA